ncbi:MAG: DUF933 domain-containing protein [Spirochaetes bacterium]|nr:DUF933 domain-containing protein [Spirochaetota bacterium]
MKIGFTGIDIPEGKIKYRDETLIALAEKDKPKKVTPYFAEFIKDEFIQCDAIAVPSDKILDLLILDMEKMETRLARTADNNEKALMEKCLINLEKETPLCDVTFSDDEAAILKGVAPCSLKPVVKINPGTDVNDIIALALEKADYIFFYTSGPTESHAWLVKKNSTIIECAEKIHSDLARGFIKGDVVAFDDYMKCHSFNECKAKGIANLVDRDYIIRPREIIEIRFNV